LIAIVVGLLLGAMALFLAALNRRLLIDTSDGDLDRAAEAWLRSRGVAADVRSLVLDDKRAVMFVRTGDDVAQPFAQGEALKAHLRDNQKWTVDAVYWKLRAPRPASLATEET